MRSHRLGALAVVLVLLLAGCGGDSGPTAADDQTATQEGSGSEQKQGPGAKRGEDDRNAPGAAKKDVPPGTSKGDGTSGGESGGEGGGEDDYSSAYYPAAGTYVYEQSGYEEFCDSSSCDKEDLPPSQDVKTTHKDRSGDSVTVVTEARSSDSRLTRTTTTHSPANALITNVQVKFNYEGFQFDNSYQPDPPVESIRYPLRSGMSWSGMWKDSTSGDYSIEVGAKRSVSVGGRTVQAYPLRTQTTFRGEFDGTADVTVWIDPATAAIVKMSGELQVKSVFGSYHTEFTATLQSAPGY